MAEELQLKIEAYFDPDKVQSTAYCNFTKPNMEGTSPGFNLTIDFGFFDAIKASDLMKAEPSAEGVRLEIKHLQRITLSLPTAVDLHNKLGEVIDLSKKLLKNSALLQSMEGESDE